MTIYSALPGPQAAPQPPSQSFLTHYWRTNHGEVGRYEAKSDVDIDSCKYRLVTAMESRTTIERGTTGLRTWLASFVLAHFLTLNPGIYIYNTAWVVIALLTATQRPSDWKACTGARIGCRLLGYCNRQHPRALPLPRCLVADRCRGKRAESLSRECTTKMQ